MFEGLKGGLASRGPVPCQVFLGKVDEGAGDIGVVGNGSTIKISKAEEGASLTLVGVGQLAMPSSLTGSMASCPGFTIIPRYLTSSVANLHFSSFRWRSSSVMHCKTHFVRSLWRVVSEE